MSELHRSAASLRIAGDDLEPTAITNLLGAEPTLSYRRGEVRPGRPGTAPARFGMWSLAAGEATPADVDRQVADILRQLTDDLAAWRQVTEVCRVDLFCGLFLERTNEGVMISPDTLVRLGERGIPLALDLYGPLEP
jgi:hypothetical protein